MPPDIHNSPINFHGTKQAGTPDKQPKLHLVKPSQDKVKTL